MKKPLLVVLSYLFFVSLCFAITSDDAYIQTQGTTWVLGTASVEKTLELRDEQLIVKGFKNKSSGLNLIAPNSTGPWTFVDAKTSKLNQGELQLDMPCSTTRSP